MAGHENGMRFRPLPTQMCVLVYTDSALYNVDADPDEEGSDGEWLAEGKQKGIRVRNGLVCQGRSEENILSMSVAAASACRDAFDFAEHTRAIWYQVVMGGEVLLDEWNWQIENEHVVILLLEVFKSWKT